MKREKHVQDAYLKYIKHRYHAATRNIPFLLTFEEWWSIWQVSGKWEQRGLRRGTYCMSRPGDKGAYEVGNVRICLNEENRAERNRNYPMKGDKNPAYGKNYWAEHGDERRAEVSAAITMALTGKKRSLETRAKMRVASKRRALKYPMSLEQRAKISAGLKKYASENPVSQEYRVKLSVARQKYVAENPGRRRVMRNGRVAYAHPSDPDYPQASI